MKVGDVVPGAEVVFYDGRHWIAAIVVAAGWDWSRERGLHYTGDHNVVGLAMRDPARGARVWMPVSVPARRLQPSPST